MLGRWRIVAIEGWDTDYIDMLGPGYVQFDPGGGQVEFGAVQIGLECWYGLAGAHFNFQCNDEGVDVSGDGDAEIEEDDATRRKPLPSWRRYALHHSTVVKSAAC